MIFSLIISLTSFILVYFTTNSLLFGSMFCGLVLMYALIYGNPSIKNYLRKQSMSVECANFINTIIVSLSISNSLESSYKDAIVKKSASLDKYLKKNSTIDVMNNLKMLSSYFKLSIYDMFLNIIKMHNENGGNILEMSVNLQLELRRKEEIINSIKQINNRKVSEFFTLWAFCLAIILFCRFGLSNIYEMMQNHPMFNYEIIFFFLFMLISVHLFISNVTKSIKKIM